MKQIEAASVQAAEPKYELHSLGWKAFQQLCVTVASEVWGQTVQGFFDAKDGGRDGAFYGTWTPKGGEVLHGSFTVQCKFFSDARKVLQLSDLSDELAKAARLAARGLADNYMLFTSARLTGAADEKIKSAFEAIPGLRHFGTYGLERISQFIRESPRLRMLVPRVYGLGDLSQILDHRAYTQAKEILSALGDDLAKFVITDAYRRAAMALVEHGFVLLLGEPACGKSTIAAALALGSLDEYGCFTLKTRDADDFVRHSNPHEPKQFFWVDDAFGATQLDWHGTVAWNKAFPHVQAAIRRGAKIVFTSRDYIYRSARNFLKESALPVLHESQVVIQVEQLAREEREQILYNHIRLGTQPVDFKRTLKTYLPAVAAHQRFSPEIARRLGNPTFTKRLDISSFGLEQFVARPMELLQEIIRTIDDSSRSAMALVFIRGGALPSPITITPDESQAIALLGGTSSEVRNSLVALDGSLLMQVQQGGAYYWRFKHPTIRDAFAALVATNRELMDIYLVGTPIPQLFAEVSCGDVGLEGVKVIVPPDRYEPVLSRVDAFLGRARENKQAVNNFLASRCDKQFLALFLSKHPAFLESLNLWSYLYAISEIDVLARFHELGLLPEAERIRHVSTIRELSVDTPDSGFLLDRIKGLLTLEEIQSILEHVRFSLLPNLRVCVDSWKDNHDGEEDPEAFFSHLMDALKDYEKEFEGDEEALALIKKGYAMIEGAIEDLRSDMPEEPDRGDYNRGGVHQAPTSESRSIFDDVDH